MKAFVIRQYKGPLEATDADREVGHRPWRQSSMTLFKPAGGRDHLIDQLRRKHSRQ